eukprot:758517-Hanusia_phi.AAC.1
MSIRPTKTNSEDKENQVPEDVRLEDWKLLLPLTTPPGAAIIKNASSSYSRSHLEEQVKRFVMAQNPLELNQDQFDKKLAEMYEKAVEEEKEEETMHPLARELKKSNMNFSDILNTKISAKGSTLRDQKKHLDDQKSLICKLREG